MTELGTRSFYSIQQVSQMTGLSRQLIRKWEERYDLVSPIRLANGYRRYDENDLAILVSAKSLNEKGYSIKQATAIVKEESISDLSSPIKTNVNGTVHLNVHLADLLEKGTKCDEIGMNSILQQAYLEFGLATFLHTVITPFMQEVGNRWATGEWDEFQESVASLMVRDFLVQLRRNNQPLADAPLILGACLPYERHEIPLHIILLQFMMKGWRTILVGTSPAPGSIQELVLTLKPDRVLLSAMTTIPFKKNGNLLTELDTFALANQNIDFFLGGPGAVEYVKGKKLNAIEVTNSVDIVLSTKPEVRKNN